MVSAGIDEKPDAQCKSESTEADQKDPAKLPPSPPGKHCCDQRGQQSQKHKQQEGLSCHRPDRRLANTFSPDGFFQFVNTVQDLLRIQLQPAEQ